MQSCKPISDGPEMWCSQFQGNVSELCCEYLCGFYDNLKLYRCPENSHVDPWKLLVAIFENKLGTQTLLGDIGAKKEKLHY